MPQTKTQYICQNCGSAFPKWSGQCPECGSWNTLVETLVEKSNDKRKGKVTTVKKGDSVISLDDVQKTTVAWKRVSTGIFECDRVFGNSVSNGKPQFGIVKGSVILLAGEPGIGKSTLITQIVSKILIDNTFKQAEDGNNNEDVITSTDHPLMYVCGEESPSQISLRVERVVRQLLHQKDHAEANTKTILNSDKWKRMFVFVTTTDVDEICSIIQNEQPSLVVVDSIQTLFTQDLTGAAGSVGQLRECTQRITTCVKALHIPTFLIGHVTKEGEIAGPKVLEHIVDTVVELSGERTSELRSLRAIKNRFGPTDEVGLFTMSEFGLEELTNPAGLLLPEHESGVAGSAVVCVREGTRPLMIEVQALAVRTILPVPRRVTQGIPLPRVQVLTAVLQRHAQIPLGEQDVFVNIAGGLQIKEPAVDLGVAMAIASSALNKSLPAKTVFIGEVGLLGEIRTVTGLEQRIKEAKRQGFTQIISRTTHQHLRQVVNSILKKAS